MDMSYGLKVSENLVKGSHSNDKRAGYVMRFNYAYDDWELLNSQFISVLAYP
jgi:hypothetical protein